jgi:hypothetical protein
VFHVQKVVEDNNLRVAIFHGPQLLTEIRVEIQAMGNVETTIYDPDGLEHSRMMDYLEDTL